MCELWIVEAGSRTRVTICQIAVSTTLKPDAKAAKELQLLQTTHVQKDASAIKLVPTLHKFVKR